MNIIPTILEKSWEEIEAKFKIYEKFAKAVHIDFLDGKFEENLTFLDTQPFSKYSSYFELEAHLMVEEPINYLEGLSKAVFKTFLGQIEKMTDQVEFVAKGEALGAVGLALDIETPISDIKIPYDDLDRILLMGIHAGASGRPFDERVYIKAKSLSESDFINIQVDGGVNDQTLPLLKNAGASIFCVNSFLFKGDPGEQYRILESLM